MDLENIPVASMSDGERKEFLKNWPASMIKYKPIVTFKIPIIYGTGDGSKEGNMDWIDLNDPWCCHSEAEKLQEQMREDFNKKMASMGLPPKFLNDEYAGWETRTATMSVEEAFKRM